MKDGIKPTVRIGIAMGEVIIADETVTGAGVVLAQRIESLSKPGSVCVTAAIHESIPERMPFDQADLGEQQLKGFDKAIHVYRVTLSAGEPVPDPENLAETKSYPGIWKAAAIILAVVLLVGGGTQFWLRPWHDRIERASVEHMAFPLPSEPSIAILPFDDNSVDQDQLYFVKGVTDSITTTISRLPGVFVIDSESTLPYKEKTIELRQVAEELSVQYILNGGVQKFQNRIRVSAKLVDALVCHQVWAERYDKDIENIFEIQDEISLNVAASLQVVLTEGQQARLVKNPTSSLDAWDLYMQAQPYFHQFTRESNAQARELALSAIELDPDYAEAWILISRTHWIDGRFGYGTSRSDSFQKALESAERALALDESNGGVYGLLGSIHLVMGNHDEAVAFGEKAVALNPNSARSFASLALVLFYSGRPDDAIKSIKRAMRLNPNYPSWYLMPLQEAYRLTGQYEKALDAIEEELRRHQFFFTHIRKALYLGTMQQETEARQAIDKALSMNPGAGIEIWEKAQFFKNPEQVRRDVSVLKSVGLP